MSEQEENELISVAMKIIIHAGDARNQLVEALNFAKQFDFFAAENLIQKAEQNIVLAHKAQTSVIQEEASGHSFDISLLFIHAQDTLMTINSELRMTKEMIDILKIVKGEQI
ncbi:PTS system, cellobiose-specific IIA component [Enterococcus sp. DIV2402]|uniref:PTS system, cellobiose-specific IIA component n=1 Tax=Candidatus Enterococcus lowellii TaxID=2230877 RepID=A0ABZ2SSH6_9ENTE|nr:PTS lactose/cellobiose transporter subunit IIA [Enterococcus sp. DIV2402]MBO0464084.1 PTS lactose/cellobiose transporter subunit IIA [Enterococcus sp. DIV2402]